MAVFGVDLTQKLFGIKNLGASTKAVLTKQKPAVAAASSYRPSGPQSTQATYGPAAPFKPASPGTAPSAGGAGGGSFQALLGRAPFESTGSGGDKDEMKRQEQFINDSFAPAINELNQFSAQLQALLPGQVANEESRGANLKQEALAEGQAQLGGLAGQKTEATQTTESAVSEARRQAAELQQGNQARFGASSGTGAFVGEQLGQQALRNISQNRQSLQNTLAKIGEAEAALKGKVQSIVSNIEQTTRDIVSKMQTSLLERVSEINISKAGLEAQKTQSKIDLVNQFRTERKAIEARNEQLKQQLFLQYEQAQGTFDKLKSEEPEKFYADIAKFEAAGLIPAEGTAYSSGQLNAPTPVGAMFRPKPVKTQEDNILSRLGINLDEEL